jgi:Rieske Fe-S protein
LNFLTGLLMAVLGLMVAVPALGFVWAPLRRKRGTEASFADVGPLSDFPAGQWRLRALEISQEDGWKKTRARHAIWVRVQEVGDQAITVLSSICPHLGCPINWHPEESRFFCPCHGGVFDASGKHIAGPPPRGMDALDFEVRAGRLWVRWQDFKIGIPERISVNV